MKIFWCHGELMMIRFMKYKIQVFKICNIDQFEVCCNWLTLRFETKERVWLLWIWEVYVTILRNSLKQSLKTNLNRNPILGEASIVQHANNRNLGHTQLYNLLLVQSLELHSNNSNRGNVVHFHYSFYQFLWFQLKGKVST